MTTVADLLHVCHAHGIRVSVAGLLRERDAASLLDCSPRTLRRWRLAGQITGRRIGGGWRYPLAEVARLLSASDQRRAPDVSTATSTQRHACPRPSVPCSISRRSSAA